jgi:hypothetical protein
MDGNSPAIQTSPGTNDKGKHKGKGKGMSKGKSLKGKPSVSYKGKFKVKGKSTSWTKGKGKPKGNYQGLRMYPTMRPPLGTSVPHNPSSTSSSTLTNSGGKGISTNTPAAPTVRCHFCNKLGHYKNNCRQYQALRNSPSYQGRLTHPARTQLIYDHLEDTVYAPRSC